ncbi:capsular polysaccharide biosynthesis protein [Bifidobacterium hapali]|uniref:Capsular polysaccharide biosynthesis protein n=1 Tax=Bifidobacterium hapali TaxID=1630172 RepID=A0A261G0G5_9BIFI|nr:glycosyltransferase [Bifidobacterium hapali]OZG64907.1 capsular polysaccharide biosynthesis protein [Bifidobacterium hapali]
MIVYKLWYRITGLLLKLLYKLTYGKHMRWGRNFHMRKGFQATCDSADGKRTGDIVIGNDVFFNNGCGLHAMNRIEIGDQTVFGENVHVYDHNHRFADPTVSYKDQGYTTAPVTIGRHCWIGSNVTVLKGGSIGDNSVIGAGCVISSPIPANSIVRLDAASLNVEPIRRAEHSSVSPDGTTSTQGSAGADGSPVPSPLRVLVLDTVMDRGGAETMMMNYLRHMDRSKVTYDFLVNRDYRAAYEDEIEALGGHIYRMCPMYPQYFGRYKKEFRAFLASHPEYRVIHSNLEERSYFGLRIAKEMGVPVRIAHAHNRPVGFDLKSIFREYFRMRLPKYTTHMFACGQEAGDWLFGKKNRAKVIQQRNAIDTAQYRYDPAVRSEVRAEFGTAEGTFVLGHVGRFFPQKNHVFLIDIFAALHKIHPNSELWLVGGGELNDELKNQIRQKVDALGLHDAVRFLGVRSDVNRIMQGMDAFVLPSLFEGLPVTMIEAQSAGLPCTISDRVPEQCNITGDVQTVPLDAAPEQWAARILSQVDAWTVDRREKGTDKVKAAGFDIVSNAAWLQDFYRDALAKAERGRTGMNGGM